LQVREPRAGSRLRRHKGSHPQVGRRSKFSTVLRGSTVNPRPDLSNVAPKIAIRITGRRLRYAKPLDVIPDISTLIRTRLQGMGSIVDALTSDQHGKGERWPEGNGYPS
jgi:hypothetical protein